MQSAATRIDHHRHEEKLEASVLYKCIRMYARTYAHPMVYAHNTCVCDELSTVNLS